MTAHVPQEVLDFVLHMKGQEEESVESDNEVRVFKHTNDTLKVFKEWVESLTNQDTTNNPSAVLHLRSADLNYISGLVQSSLEETKTYIRGRMIEILEEGINK